MAYKSLVMDRDRVHYKGYADNHFLLLMLASTVGAISFSLHHEKIPILKKELILKFIRFKLLTLGDIFL